MPPELENLLKQVQIDGTLSAKDFVSSLFFTEDSDYIKEFRNDFKNRFLQPLARQLKNVKPEDIKKVFDPFGISDVSEELADDFKKYHEKLKSFLKIDLPEIKDETPKQKLKDTNVEATIPDKVKDKVANDIEEAETFGPKVTTITFDDSTKDFFQNLFGTIDGLQLHIREENRKQNKYYDESLKKQDELIALSNGSGILGTMAKLLAVGGVAALLVSTFWDSHIQPWLEEKFPNINWTFFDKFEGLIEGIGKFFTLGAAGAGGALLKLQGKVFQSIADVLDNSIGSVLKAIFGEAAEGGAAKLLAGSAKVLSGSFFARIGANLFKGIGIAALKGIPYIGAIISIGFAIDRFNKSDWVGGTIDLIGGLVNLIPGAGIPLSLGLAALNTFLDLKYGGTGDAGKETQSKLSFFGDIAKNIYDFLMKIPVIGGMVDGVVGLWNLLYSLAGGDQIGAKKALEQMTNFPILGALPSIMLAFLDITDTPEGSTASKLNLPNFLDAFKKRVGKTVLSWFSWLPTSWQKSIADFMGVPFGGEENQGIDSAALQRKGMQNMRDLPEDAEYTKQGAEKLQSLRTDTYEAYQRSKNEMSENDNFYGKYLSDRYQKSEEQFNYLADTLSALDERIRKYNELNPEAIKEKLDDIKDSNSENLEEMKRIRENNKKKEPETVKVDDFYKPASGRSTLIYDQVSEKKYETAPNDDVFAMKPGGLFDTTFKEIKNIILDVNKNIVMLNDGIYKLKPNNSQVTTINSSGNENEDYLLDLSRDPVFNSRANWWRVSERIKATIS